MLSLSVFLPLGWLEEGPGERVVGIFGYGSTCGMDGAAHDGRHLNPQHHGSAYEPRPLASSTNVPRTNVRGRNKLVVSL